MQKLRLREGEGPSEREKRKEKEKHPKTRRSRAGFRFLSEKVRRKTAAPSPSILSFAPRFFLPLLGVSPFPFRHVAEERRSQRSPRRGAARVGGSIRVGQGRQSRGLLEAERPLSSKIWGAGSFPGRGWRFFTALRVRRSTRTEERREDIKRKRTREARDREEQAGTPGRGGPSDRKWAYPEGSAARGRPQRRRGLARGYGRKFSIACFVFEV